MNILELHCGDLHMGVLPELGGALAWLRHREADLLRPWDRTPSVRRTACYPLVPYSNRIAFGRFSLHGQPHELARNFGEHPHPIHGVGWQRAWQVVEHSAQHCVMRLSHDADEHWPFAFSAEQTLILDEQGLSLSLSVKNESRETMPAGLGWHPYFPRHEGLELQFEAAAVWLSDQQALPAERVEVPPQWRFSERRRIGHVGLDNCFEGWNRQACVYWPQSGLALELVAGPGLEHLVVFTPLEPQDFIAVEPVSHLNNAVNRPSPQANGIVLLESGHQIERCLRINVRQLAAGATA
jgi:aldose 1-epimerase